MSEGSCSGQHRLHVADVAVVPAEGKVCILALCLNCGQGFKNEHLVAKPGVYIGLDTKKENSNESIRK